MNSSYQIPIFISSTEYNLIDLRAELAQFLSSQGYSPRLSSGEGFQDQTPNLHPWESCLPVIDSCFLVILIIDGRYGQRLDWPSYKDSFGSASISPTHAEYLYAHQKRKRVLVFVRDDILTHYDTYRQALKKANSKHPKARSLVSGLLPGRIELDVFEFLHHVKTSAPIPWLRPFSSVVDLKREIQAKLLNELAEVFMLRQQHEAVIISAFSRLMEEVDTKKRDEILQGIGITREISGELKVQIKKAKEAEETLSKLSTELEKAKSEVKKTKDESKKKEWSDRVISITALAGTKQQELHDFRTSINLTTASSFYNPVTTGPINIGLGSSFVPATGITFGAPVIGTSFGVPASSGFLYQAATSVGSIGSECPGCKHNNLYSFPLRKHIFCSGCSRSLCESCWPQQGKAQCPDCEKKVKK